MHSLPRASPNSYVKRKRKKINLNHREKSPIDRLYNIDLPEKKQQK